MMLYYNDTTDDETVTITRESRLNVAWSYALHGVAFDRQVLQNTFLLNFPGFSKYSKSEIHAGKGQREDDRLFSGIFCIVSIEICPVNVKE